MNRRIIFLTTALVVQLFSCNEPVLAKETVKEFEPLNFVLLLTDDQSYHLSLIGTSGIHTPNMDALARQVFFFTKAYAAAVSCSPCRSSILTGMYPHSNGHWRNTVTPEMRDSDNQLSRQSSIIDEVGAHEDLPTLIELLNRNEYVTGITEKFHLSTPWKFPFNFRFSASNRPILQHYFIEICVYLYCNELNISRDYIETY